MIDNLKQYETFTFPKTNFVGFETLKATGTIQALFTLDGQQVVSLHGHGFVIFDQTPLYAMSGGQVSDLGTISFHQQEIKYLDLRKDVVYGYYIHEIDTDNIELKIGDQVEIEVYSDFRNKASIHHSAIHVVWQSILNAVGHYVHEVGSKLDDKKCQLQFDVDDKITPDLVARVVEKVNNEIIPANIKSHIFEVTHQEAIDKNYLYGFTKITGDDLVRMVEFPGIVIEPCSGTHVLATGEIKRVWFLTYDKNPKRILMDMTTNEEYAREYFTERLDKVIDTMIKKVQVLDNKNNFQWMIDEAQSMRNTWTYDAIKKVYALYEKIIGEVNIFNKKNEKQILNNFANLELTPEIINDQYFVFTLDNDIYTNKILLTKATKLAEENKDKIIVFINENDNGINSIIMRNKEFDFNLKALGSKIMQATQFKGGGTDSMLQLVSANKDDVKFLLNLLQE